MECFGSVFGQEANAKDYFYTRVIGFRLDCASKKVGKSGERKTNPTFGVWACGRSKVRAPRARFRLGCFLAVATPKAWFKIAQGAALGTVTK